MSAMKKQFIKVKQFADNLQTLGRSGKATLGDDLQLAEQKVDYLRNSCQNVSKKISAYLPTQGDSGGKDREKSMKKCPEHALATTFKQFGALEEQVQCSLRTCLILSGEAEVSISGCHADKDQNIDTMVVNQLNSLLESEISKLRRKVNQLQSERDKLEQAQNKHGGNTPANAVKTNEFDELTYKLDQSTDLLAMEMFKFISKESDICHCLLQFYKWRRTFYHEALQRIDQLIPNLEIAVAESSCRKIYGTKLEDHLRVTNRTIAYPIELCVCALLHHGLEDEGLFRIGGKQGKVKRMQLCFDAGCMTRSTAMNCSDPFVIADCLKRYLRELPEPIMTFDLCDEWLEAGCLSVPIEQKRKAIKAVVDKLREAQYRNLSYLFQFFHKLSTLHEVNKMTSQNIAIVIAPNMLWTDRGTFLPEITQVVQLMVQNPEHYFDIDPDFTFYVHLDPEANGESEGIDNKGFAFGAADNGMKRSQSTSSLTEEATPGSPKPYLRQKKKQAAPSPPNQPTRPPLPTASLAGTLPRSTRQKDHKATCTEDPMTQSVGSVEAFIKTESDSEVKLRPKEDKKIKATVGTDTDDLKPDPKIVKVKPDIPVRPVTLKPQLRKPINDSRFVPQNYENVYVSSSENLSGEEKTVKTHASLYSIDKKQTEIIKVKKRDRSREKKKSVERESKESPPPPAQTSQESVETTDGEDEKKTIAADLSEIRRSSDGLTKRPSSLSGCDKPERPPKPDHITSPSSHARTLSDSQIIDRVVRDVNANEGSKQLIKHPTTSPPPPPVPVKPRANSQGDSTDL